jgi:hypothetical protein
MSSNLAHPYHQIAFAESLDEPCLRTPKTFDILTIGDTDGEAGIPYFLLEGFGGNEHNVGADQFDGLAELGIKLQDKLPIMQPDVLV